MHTYNPFGIPIFLTIPDILCGKKGSWVSNSKMMYLTCMCESCILSSCFAENNCP